MRNKKRLTEHQILFTISFFAGIIFVTIMAGGKLPENTIMNHALGQALLEEGWNKKELLLQCLFSRGSVFIVMFVLGNTSMRNWMFRAVTIWIGAAFGMLLKLFYLWYGIKGMGLFAAALLPQYIFYWMAYGLLYWESDRNRMYARRNYIPMVLTIGVVIMGIFLESYVNPFLVNGIVKMLF